MFRKGIRRHLNAFVSMNAFYYFLPASKALVYVDCFGASGE
jgi:hypothetical protein